MSAKDVMCGYVGVSLYDYQCERKWSVVTPRMVTGEILSYIVRSLLPWAIKGRDGSLMKGFPILSEEDIPLRSKVSIWLGFLLGFRLVFSCSHLVWPMRHWL